MNKKYKNVSGTYNQLWHLVGKKGGLPPLPKSMQQSIDRTLEKFGSESEEYIFLADKIIYVGAEWMIDYVND